MSKKARSEGARVASLIKGNKAQWYVSDVDLEDDYEALSECMEAVKKTLGRFESNYLLITAGVKYLIVSAFNLDWLSASISNISGDTMKENNLVRIEIDTPFKLKDIVRANAFKFLREKGAVEEDI